MFNNSLLNKFNSLKTPFYYYDLDILKNNISELISSLEKNNKVHFALKSNSNKKLLELIKLSGIGICLGTLSSIIIIFFQSIYKFISIPDTVYFISYLPVDLEFKNILLTLILSLTFSSITSYILGSKISKISIIKILQWVK